MVWAALLLGLHAVGFGLPFTEILPFTAMALGLRRATNVAAVGLRGNLVRLQVGAAPPVPVPSAAGVQAAVLDASAVASAGVPILGCMSFLAILSAEPCDCVTPMLGVTAVAVIVAGLVIGTVVAAFLRRPSGGATRRHGEDAAPMPGGGLEERQGHDSGRLDDDFGHAEEHTSQHTP